MSRLKTTQWNDRGELLHEGVVVPGSNVVDLVHDLLRTRKTSDPIGWQQFGSQMRAANIPMELVGNVARRRHIQQRKRTLTPKQKKGRRVQLPDDWESYKNQTLESRSSQHGSTVHGSGNHKRRRCHNSLSSHLADDVTQSYHQCPGGVVPWDARNYSNDTTILNVSEVMAALLLCEE